MTDRLTTIQEVADLPSPKLREAGHPHEAKTAAAPDPPPEALAKGGKIKRARTLSPGHRAALAAGRERAAAARKAKGVTKSPKRRTVLKELVNIARHPELLDKAAPHEFLGITRTDCPIGCTAEHCVITGMGHCGHPCKGGIQPVHMSNRDTVERYNRARKHLAHVELDKRP
jgi:hypothetical protein